MEREPASPLLGASWIRSNTLARATTTALAASMVALAAEPSAPTGRSSASAGEMAQDTLSSKGEARDTTTQPSFVRVAILPERIAASAHFALGAGAPAFPQRDRFRLESARRAEIDSLSLDQPWDGSQLGFSSSLEAALRWRFLRSVAAAQWTFWDSRAVLRNPRTGELLERTWRIDQLVGQVGFDALVPRGLLTISNARDPYVGWRASYGVGRLEGLGRAWARGGGWQIHLGADVWSFGPMDLGGRFGWSALAMESDEPFSRVLYEGSGSDALTWNGSGLWLELVLRYDTHPGRNRKATSPAQAPSSSGAN